MCTKSDMFAQSAQWAGYLEIIFKIGIEQLSSTSALYYILSCTSILGIHLSNHSFNFKIIQIMTCVNVCFVNVVLKYALNNPFERTSN